MRHIDLLKQYKCSRCGKYYLSYKTYKPNDKKFCDLGTICFEKGQFKLKEMDKLI